MALGLMPAYGGCKFHSRYELQKLGEDAAYSIHGGVLSWVVLDFRQISIATQSEAPPELFYQALLVRPTCTYG
jgi:hypothetical protein